MKIKARIIEKDSLEQMFNIRKDFNSGWKKGKMSWDNIDIETVYKELDNDRVMVFTKRFGEINKEDKGKIEALMNK